MKLQSTCPHCRSAYNRKQHRCEDCQSYIFTSSPKYWDWADKERDIQQNSDQYPGIDVSDHLLAKGEKPITIGLANYFTKGLLSVGGKLLLTNQKLYFRAHLVNLGRKEVTIPLKDITEVKVSGNFLISQRITVSTSSGSHKFAVFHGKKWVQKMHDAINHCHEAVMDEDVPAAT